jgi:predicted nucleic acid-binding protein
LAWLCLFGSGLMLSDDQDARRAAAALGFQVTGTVGILLRAERQRRLGRQELLDLIRSIRSRTSLHVSEDFIASVLASIPHQ